MHSNQFLEVIANHDTSHPEQSSLRQRYPRARATAQRSSRGSEWHSDHLRVTSYCLRLPIQTVDTMSMLAKDRLHSSVRMFPHLSRHYSFVRQSSPRPAPLVYAQRSKSINLPPNGVAFPRIYVVDKAATLFSPASLGASAIGRRG